MRNLDTTGLSLSQAQTISNLCNQRCLDITSLLSNINNVEKSLKYGEEIYIETVAKPIPADVKQLLLEKAKLHATQAFLMEAIKGKDTELNKLRFSRFNSTEVHPQEPEYKYNTVLPTVAESWGWEQLSDAEYNDYLEAEAYAAHIGQFIHKGSVLDNLRKELPSIKTLEWIEIAKDSKVPLTVKIHHTQEQLLSIHNDLASEHRNYEQKVNFFKAKVKNLVTTENARIAQVNAKSISETNEFNNVLRNKYNSELQVYEAMFNQESQIFEKDRQEKTKEIANYRIKVDPRFQETVDKFLKTITTQSE